MIFSLFNQYFISLAFAKQLWKEFAVLQKFASTNATRNAPYTFVFHIYASLIATE